MVTSGICHLVIYFPKIYHSGEKGALITFVIFKSDTPTTLLPLSLFNTFEGQGYCGLGVNRTGHRRRRPLLDIFRCGLSFGVDLVFFKG